MVKIRKLQSDDNISTIIRLLNQVSTIRKTNSDLNIYHQKVQSILEHQNIHYYCLVNDQEDMVGLGCLMIRPTICHGLRNIAYIEDIVIDKKERGHGYGRIMVDHLVNQAKELNCYKIILQCDPKLIGFYNKSGLETSSNVMMHHYYN